MCLATKGTFKPCKVGYKVMKDKSNGLCGEICSQSQPRRIGVWLDEANFRSTDYEDNLITIQSNSHYPFGWHIFHTEEDARDWRLHHVTSVVVKVSVKEPVAVGYQGFAGRRITVAKKIKILEVLPSIV